MGNNNYFESDGALSDQKRSLGADSIPSIQETIKIQKIIIKKEPFSYYDQLQGTHEIQYIRDQGDA
ncbi:hypothetical protein Mpsy_0500 [Methanolobus psychrophilus R15]|nr:hypothetical protein Mpsy_0500 [Methanolobus psychrophilus R15]